MSDKMIAYNQIKEFMKNDNEKTMLLSGISDTEKHQILLKSLNDLGNLTGLINLVHTDKHGMENFFRWSELYKVKVPKKYREKLILGNLNIFFDNITTNNSIERYDNQTFDFMIIWPIQSVTKHEDEIKTLKEMSLKQKTNKIIFLTIKEPWIDPSPFRDFVDKEVILDCQNDNPDEYERIQSAYQEDIEREKYWNEYQSTTRFE